MRGSFRWQHGVAVLGLLLLNVVSATAVAGPQPGIDPTKEPLVAAFACYSTAAGEASVTPGFVLEILPGRRYRIPQGEGTFAIDASETVQTIAWTGPLANDIPSTAFFDDQGQSIGRVTPPGATRSSQCYQRGPREQAEQAVFRAKDLQPGSYPCVTEDGAPGVTVEIQAGRRYAVGGVAGAYTIDILGQQNETWASIDFVDGPFAGDSAYYTPDLETGLRSLSLFVGPRQKCNFVVAPTPPPAFGVAKAPKQAKLRDGLVGTYASYQPDVVGACGGLCWTFRTFTQNGYVYTRQPETGRSDAACDKTRPNGLKVCDRYVVKGRTIRIGDDPPKAFTRGKGFIRIDGRKLSLVGPLGPPLQLSGAYRSFSYIQPVPGQGGVAVEGVYRFLPNGRFTREGFAGATFTPPPGQPGVSVVTSSQNGSAGRYKVVSAANTIELRFDNGAVQRLFAFIPINSGRLPSPEVLRMGGTDYLPKKG